MHPGFLLAVFGVALAAGDAGQAHAEQQMKVRLTWGHRSAADTGFTVQLLAEDAKIMQQVPLELEPGEGPRDGLWRTCAGGGDVDGVELVLSYRPRPPRQPAKLNSMWATLLQQSDADTARRLRSDPAFQGDTRKLTVQIDDGDHKGFSVAVCQLLEHRAMWVPALDVYITAGDQAVDFSAHQQQLRQWQGKRILDQVRDEPEATYQQWKSRWEDMGSPQYVHPSQPEPGHIVCLGWDSSVYKFGVDRGGGVRNDLGSPDRFRCWFDFGALDKELARRWKGQKLDQGLPIITTTIERQGFRYELEQFAYPLHGPPQQRRGDIPMLLLQKVTVVNLKAERAVAAVTIHHRRQLPAQASLALAPAADGSGYVLSETGDGRLLLAVQGHKIDVRLQTASDDKTPDKQSMRAGSLSVAMDLPAGGSETFVVKLASPPIEPAEADVLCRLDYAAAREAARRFWLGYLERGAQFQVAEEPVNELFRANLWHALRLPRRHGGSGDGLRIDLPYSNFAYGQQGTPWPINQAVYVDYMLYDLRGYHDLSAEELAVIFRGNQQPDGRVGGYANWVVYTPGMIYAVAQHYLLSGDRQSFERLLPQTLKALDWCLAELQRANKEQGPARGLVRGPLNDLTGEGVWAFNQAYMYAALERLGRALEQIGHPRSGQCKAAATALREAIVRGFGAAAVRSPLVQLRDHTWWPYVPSEAASAGRRFDQWYPTDVDTGALHLPRLCALAARHHLTEYLLHDHEDNLFLHGWGMANEPVYNPQATVYLLRDEPAAAIRAFYSMMACAFSHSVFEPVEHRWTWGQYFGPPSTDGAWFELYRKMLIDERDDDSLLLLQATPRTWLADGKQIVVRRAPTYFGPISMTVDSHAAQGRIVAEILTPQRRLPKAIIIRLRHPQGQPIRSVSVNGENWTAFDGQKQSVHIERPRASRYLVVAHY